MLELINEIDIKNLNKKHYILNLYAGLLCDKSGNPIKKILYTKNPEGCINVFNDQVINLDEYSIMYETLIDDVVYHFFYKDILGLHELLLVYKMFLNDDHFLRRHLDYFDMMEIEIGYKGKKEIIPKMSGYFPNSKIYEKLINIINFNRLVKDDIFEKNK